MSKQAAEAAWQVLESSGLQKIEGQSNIYHQGGQYTVKYCTVLRVANPITRATTDQTVVFSVILADKVYYSQITTEPHGGLIWGVGEDPPTEAGAVSAARRMIDFILKPR